MLEQIYNPYYYNNLMEMNSQNINYINNMMNYLSNNNKNNNEGISFNLSQRIDEIKSTTLPKIKGSIYFELFCPDGVKKINVIFIVENSFKAILVCPITATIKEILNKFIEKIGLSPNAINSLLFLCNGTALNKKENTLENYGISEGANIFVINIKNLLGV